MPQDPGAIAALLAPFRTALLVTRGEDGHLRCRPMSMRHEVRGEEIWFASAPEATKCRDLEADPRCALVFFDAGSGRTVSVAGAGEVIRDRKLLASLWDPAWFRWFPGGPDPRTVALLRVIPERVERHAPDGSGAEVVFERVGARP